MGLPDYNLFRDSRKEFLCLFPFMEPPTPLGLQPLHLQANSTASSIPSNLSSVLIFSLTLTLLIPSYQDLCDYIGHTGTRQNDLLFSNSLITSVKFLCPVR